jgi:hypothetical protein
MQKCIPLLNSNALFIFPFPQNTMRIDKCNWQNMHICSLPHVWSEDYIDRKNKMKAPK